MIVFFYGEETFQSSEKLKKMKTDFLEKNISSEPIIFDCDEKCSVSDIVSSFAVQDLFSQEKMIIIENLFANTKADDQKDILNSLDVGTSDTVIFIERGVPRKNAKLFVWLKENANTFFESKKLQGHDLEKWIKRTCHDRDIKISDQAVRELVLYVGDDLWLLSQEINKLGSYTAEKGVDVADVQLLVHGRVDADMFQTVESIVSGNKGNAMTLLKRQIAKGDDAFHIFSMYAYQLRTLLLVSGVVSDDHVYDKSGIAKTLKMHPFVVQKSLTMLQKTPQEQIKKIHKKLTSLDQDIKQGRRTVFEALDIFIASV